MRGKEDIGKISTKISNSIRAVTKEEVKQCMIDDKLISIEGIVGKIHRDRNTVGIYYLKYRREGLG